ncbi:hypothetical protein KIH74_21960 [Kineosporia sp. J2-2]|uniref:Outer membrane channel protein CpnT-like N-terminal domain-containing protein n=1 Tax=Kineosporia corallincola TaxID=2835133 RepID=A0ABS5TKJ5_9ACTN|nr:hypothetical protein [Kineosporia corallincola]MBT0771620.1 hypothetical protein [Kineosporia corallincola]
MDGLDPALEWVWDALVLATSWQQWPDGDPGAWRELGDAWGELASTIEEAFQGLGADATNVAMTWGGDAGEAFVRRWGEFVGADGLRGCPVVHL